jgi:hypothetical protein
MNIATREIKLLFTFPVPPSPTSTSLKVRVPWPGCACSAIVWTINVIYWKLKISGGEAVAGTTWASDKERERG